VHYDLKITEVSDSRIYVSCRVHEAVMFIPTTQLRGFPQNAGVNNSNALHSYSQATEQNVMRAKQKTSACFFKFMWS